MFLKHNPPVGSAPDVLAPVTRFPSPKIHVIDYTSDHIEETDIVDTKELIRFKSSSSISWIDIQGLGDENILKSIGEIFDLNPLTLADIVNIPTRPKQDEHDDYLFIISCMIDMPDSFRINIEQISIILGHGFVITFQENYGDVLDPIRNRLRQNRGIIRKSGADYLTYSILDALIDGYYPVLEALGESIETLESKAVTTSDRNTLTEIYELRRELLQFRRAVWPQREVINGIMQDSGKFFKKNVGHNLRDVYEHCFQVMDVIETYREICGGLTDVYLSGLSNKLNDIMKVLTVISTVFIPLTFITSIYGMNFEFMPELHYKAAYPILMVIILAIAILMLKIFHRRGWLSSKD